jgi:membrane protein YdbS with pleckstrin-like domain
LLNLGKEGNEMDEQAWRQIDSRAPSVWRMTNGIISLILWLVVLGSIVLHTKFGMPIVIIFGLMAVALLHFIFEIVILPKLQWRRWRYQITEHEIDLQYGVFITKRTVIPMVRVQHVDTKQGPFLRRYGLASVAFSTAAGSHEIPALSVETADEVRNRIAELARVSDEDV